jgi:hypothetical protein
MANRRQRITQLEGLSDATRAVDQLARTTADNAKDAFEPGGFRPATSG